MGVIGIGRGGKGGAASSTVDVKKFGAKGDGVTDDTEAIQKAINSLTPPTRTWQPSNRVEGGGIIFFPKGEFLVTESLLYFGGVTFKGDNKMSATIKFSPSTEQDLFVSDDTKMTRDGLHQEAVEIHDLTLVGDQIGGVNAKTAINFEKVLSLKLTRVNIFNFDIGLLVGANAYYGVVDDCDFRANRLNVKNQSTTGPLIFNGGFMEANATEWGLVATRMDCFIEAPRGAKVVLNDLAAELRAGCPVNEGFMVFRGAVDGSGAGIYSINGTYHEVSSEYPLVELDMTRHYGEGNVSPLSSYSNIAKLKNFKSSETESIVYASDKQFPQRIARFGTGTLTPILKNSMLKNGKYLDGNLAAAAVLDTEDEFFAGIPTLKIPYTATATGSYPYYWDIPVSLYSKYEGNFLVFSVISKVSGGASYMAAVQIYINGTQTVTKQTNSKSIDYGNGYVMHTMSAYIPVGNNSTSLRVSMRVNVVDGSAYNLAYMSICLNGDDKYLPDNNNDNYVAAAAPTKGSFLVGDKVYNSAPSAGGYLGWVCTTAGSPGTWKTFGAITP